jgi:diadenosine tetraphosphate (Ap4A) HIT family hydrolase
MTDGAIGQQASSGSGNTGGSAHSNAVAGCSLCEETGGELLWSDRWLRVIAAHEPDYPGFCRVVWSAHVAEFSDLDAAQQQHLMQVVATVERVIRRVMTPQKINLASLGNQVPHVHWHVIPRYADDAHFPAPIWATERRVVEPVVIAKRVAQADGLRLALAEALDTLNTASSH